MSSICTARPDRGVFRSSEPGNDGYMLMAADGTIISHNDKTLLLTPGGKQPFMQEFLAGGSREGYAFRELEGVHLLYTWSRSESYGWWNVNTFSVDELMTKTRVLQRSILLITE